MKWLAALTNRPTQIQAASHSIYVYRGKFSLDGLRKVGYFSQILKLGRNLSTTDTNLLYIDNSEKNKKNKEKCMFCFWK